jgi:GTP-binding protein
MKDIRVISAELGASCGNASQFPEDGLPEIAFLGRSNVGKSSLINALVGVNALARTSKSPGRTQLLHFFRVCIRSEEFGDREFYLVDFPGFGYAKVSRGMKRSWVKLIEDYFASRDPLTGVVLLNDARRDPQGEEIWIRQNYDRVGFALAVTKGDKLSKSDLGAKRMELARDFDLSPSDVIATSVLKGKRRGLQELTNRLYSWGDDFYPVDG